MKQEVTLIFPHQLVLEHQALDLSRPVWIIEDFLFFRLYRFHKQKIIFHRASLRSYEQNLIQKGYKVRYIESTELTERNSLRQLLAQNSSIRFHIMDVTDTWLENDLRQSISEENLIFYPSQIFLSSREEITPYFSKTKKPFMKNFYEWQRKRLGILMEKNLTPVGGRYSFDTENRKRLPRDYQEPIIPKWNNPDLIMKEAFEYQERFFPDAPGESAPFNYPVTHREARVALHTFISERLSDFGPYEDALGKDETTLHHSVLSALLNIGLLTPQEVVTETLLAYEKNSLPLASVEGFIRQIIGWREFMRGVYLCYGTKIRKGNFFEHHNTLSREWWQGSTGILPLDTTIRKILQTAYIHHIERLMIIGNYMLLSQIHPDDVYRWFMELSIDSYDWVMVPNVYSMSQYADGGSITTKPYFSGSNYILKMSNYPKGEWSTVWDNLFWNFVERNQTFLKKNYRLALLVAQLHKRKDSIDK